MDWIKNIIQEIETIKDSDIAADLSEMEDNEKVVGELPISYRK